MVGKDTRGDPEKQGAKPLAPAQREPTVDERAKAADEARAKKQQEAKLHEMRHLTNPHEMEHNYHEPDKSDEGEKPPTGHPEAVEHTGTLTGKAARGASAYGPGPPQQPLHKLKETRR